MYFISFHLANLSLSSSFANVSDNFVTLNDGRFSNVVGMHRLTALVIRDCEKTLNVRTSNSSKLDVFLSKSSDNAETPTNTGSPSLGGFGKVADRPWLFLRCRNNDGAAKAEGGRGEGGAERRERLSLDRVKEPRLRSNETGETQAPFIILGLIGGIAVKNESSWRRLWESGVAGTWRG